MLRFDMRIQSALLTEALVARGVVSAAEHLLLLMGFLVSTQMGSRGELSVAILPIALVLANTRVGRLYMATKMLFAGKRLSASFKFTGEGTFIVVGTDVHFETTGPIIPCRASFVWTSVIPESICLTKCPGSAVLGEDGFEVVDVICSETLLTSIC